MAFTFPKVGFSLFFLSLLSATLILSVFIIKNTTSVKTKNIKASCENYSTRCYTFEDVNYVQMCVDGEWKNDILCDFKETCKVVQGAAQCL